MQAPRTSSAGEDKALLYARKISSATKKVSCWYQTVRHLSQAHSPPASTGAACRRNNTLLWDVRRAKEKDSEGQRGSALARLCFIRHQRVEARLFLNALEKNNNFNQGRRAVRNLEQWLQVYLSQKPSVCLENMAVQDWWRSICIRTNLDLGKRKLYLANLFLYSACACFSVQFS